MVRHDPVFIDNRFIGRIGNQAGRIPGSQNVCALLLQISEHRQGFAESAVANTPNVSGYP